MLPPLYENSRFVPIFSLTMRDQQVHQLFFIFTFAMRFYIIYADNKEHAEIDDSEWI